MDEVNITKINIELDGKVSPSVEKVKDVLEEIGEVEERLDDTTQKTTESTIEQASKIALLTQKLQILKAKYQEASESGKGNAAQLNSIALSYKGVQEQIQRLMPSLTKDENNYPFKNLDSGALIAKSRVELLKMKLDELKGEMEAASGSSDDQTKRLTTLALQYKSTKEQLDKLIEAERSAGEETEKATSRFTKFLRQLQRIAVYRAIRTVLKDITTSFKEGINNLYQWSILNDNVFARSMNDLATSILYTKNALGTALAPILESVVIPLVHTLSDALADAINLFNQFIAAIQGEGFYTRAIRKQTEFAKATANTGKAIRNTLLGFDEINRLNDNSGGGGNNLDYSGMFEKAPVGNWIGELAVEFKDLVFNWSNLNQESIAKKIVAGLTTVAGGLIGFSLGPAGALVGSIAGLSLGMWINSLVFNNDGQLSQNELQSLLWYAVNGLIGGVAGAVVTKNAKGALLGFEIGVALTALVKQLAVNADTRVNAGTLFAPVMAAITGGAIGWKIGGIKGAVLGGAIGISVTTLVQSIQALAGRGQYSKQEMFNLLAPALGGMLFGLVGGIVAGPTGALIGFTIGSILTIAISGVEFKGLEEALKFATTRVENYSDKMPNLAVQAAQERGKTLTSKVQNQLNIEAAQERGKKLTEYYKNVQAKAEGGYVDAGTLFIAGESGAEFVGNINGKTGVMNTQQFADANRPVVEAVLAIGNAIVSAVQENKDVYVDGKKVTDIVRTNNSRLNKAYGI